MKRLRNQKGVTLVELLAGLAIGGIIISLAMSVFMFLFQYYQDQEQEIVERSQNHILNAVLSRNLSSPITVFYWDSNEIRFQNQNELFLRIFLDNTTNELVLSKCSTCTNFQSYNNEAVIEKIQNVEEMNVLNKSSSQTTPITKSFTLNFTLEDKNIRTNGEQVVKEKEFSWTVTPLNKKYNKPPD